MDSELCVCVGAGGDGGCIVVGRDDKECDHVVAAGGDVDDGIASNEDWRGRNRVGDAVSGSVIDDGRLANVGEHAGGSLLQLRGGRGGAIKRRACEAHGVLHQERATGQGHGACAAIEHNATRDAGGIRGGP